MHLHRLATSEWAETCTQPTITKSEDRPFCRFDGCRWSRFSTANFQLKAMFIRLASCYGVRLRVFSILLSMWFITYVTHIMWVWVRSHLDKLIKQSSSAISSPISFRGLDAGKAAILWVEQSGGHSVGTERQETRPTEALSGRGVRGDEQVLEVSCTRSSVDARDLHTAEPNSAAV